MKQRRKNTPAHLHVPARVVQLGTVLDMTTQDEQTRTVWDEKDVGGMVMCCDADGMQRRAGAAALYLLRGTPRAANAAPDTFTISIERVRLDRGGYDSQGRYFGVSKGNRHVYRATSSDGLLDIYIRGDEGEDARDVRKRAHDEHAKLARKRNGSCNDAIDTYTLWHDREPEGVRQSAELPDLINVRVGDALRIGYRSDKWNKRGTTTDYDHDYTEPQYKQPEVWADCADLSKARVIVIVGGNQRVTPEGID